MRTSTEVPQGQDWNVVVSVLVLSLFLFANPYFTTFDYWVDKVLYVSAWKIKF